LNECCLRVSSAAAELIMSDEGTRSVSDWGRVSLGTFFARTKKVPRPSRAKPMTSENKKMKITKLPCQKMARIDKRVDPGYLQITKTNTRYFP
jgi:hypothetical protein